MPVPAPRARAARIQGDSLVVDLEPATAPLWAEQLYLGWRTIPALAAAAPAEREAVEVTGGGEGLRWPLIDADLSVAGLLRGEIGRPAGGKLDISAPSTAAAPPA